MEVELPAILNAWLSAVGNFTEQSTHLDDFLRFYLFFDPAGYRESVQRKSLLRRATEGSSEYRLSVGEDLKGQTFEALRVCIEGFLAFAPNNLNPDDHLLICREQSFILLCQCSGASNWHVVSRCGTRNGWLYENVAMWRHNETLSDTRRRLVTRATEPWRALKFTIGKHTLCPQFLLRRFTATGYITRAF